jgi:ferredoxin-NADP reductase
MPTYQSKLKSREQIAEGTVAFHFEKPAGFQFKPGQFADLRLVHPPETDPQGSIRTFSIASAPYEDELLFATRMRDSTFKRLLATLPMGTSLTLDGPMGSFTLHKNPSKAAVFLAGGIGITPFRSILRQAAEEKLPHLLYLFYSNRRPEDAPFLKELQDLAVAHPKFIFIPTITNMARSKMEWRGDRGFINWELLAGRICDLHGPIYYIAGPPAMVAAMQEMLTKAEVNEDDVRTEEFGGY